MLYRLLEVCFVLTFPCFTESACTWPAAFISSTWIDGFKDELVFTTNTMTGWKIKVDNLDIDGWECFRDESFTSDGYLEMKTATSFILYRGSKFYGYICMKMTKITDVSYRYYIYAPNQKRVLSEERFDVKPIDDTVETSCNQENGATGSEYHVMIKLGNEQSARVDCPYVFLGMYGYSMTTSDGTITCDTANSDWDTCAETSSMSFDKNKCSANVAYSDSSTLMCVDSVPVGTNHVVTVFDLSGPVDNADTFKFTCFAISYDGSQASVSPRTCKEEQTPDQIPSASDGSPDGATIEMTLNGDKCPTCPGLPGISGGSLLYLTDGAVTYATYTCDDQYDLYGTQRRRCQANNTWSDDEPKCKCKAPQTPVNGNVTVSADGTTATYTCDPGYIMKGSNTRICQATNAWDGVEPTCESCDAIVPPINGTYTYVQKGSTTTADFACNAGTTMKGSNSSICQSNGTWNIDPPLCVTCKTMQLGSSLNVTFETDGMVSTAVFSCMDGYVLIGNASIKCNFEGDWTAAIPSCECSEPVSPANGFVQYNGSVVLYACAAGYNMVGENKRYCQSNGLGWNGTTPSCEKCENLTTPSGGSVNVSTDGQISSAEFTCKTGYVLKGQQTTKCQVNLIWDTLETECVLCKSLTAPSSGNVSLSTNGLVTIATHTCADGYEMVGSDVLTCNTNGEWTNTPPTCECIVPAAPLNGKIEPDADRKSLYYFCDVMYSLSTVEFIRYCQEDGSGWTGEEPTCRKCPELPEVDGGSSTLQTDKTITFVEYTCNIGYSMNGASKITCTTQGAWESVGTTCSKCVNISSSPGRSHEIDTDGIKSTAIFSCEIQYTLDGTRTATCDQNGNWNPSFPNCAKCTSKKDPASGRVNVTSDGQTTQAIYSCESGYFLDGGEILLCRPDGIWNGPDPVCKCKLPAAPVKGNVTFQIIGKIATYTCDAGYTLNGSHTRWCGNDGTGWNGSDPSCVACETIPVISTGFYNLTSNGTLTKVYYTCSNGATINGESVLTCGTDGTWGVISFPICEKCPDLIKPSDGNVLLSSNGSVSSAIFECLSGYEIYGERELTCQENGTWNYAAPSCVCIAPSKPQFGSLDISSDKMTVYFSCEVGYTLNGDASRVCLSNGAGWNGTNPTCFKCAELEEPNGGNYSLQTTGTQTEVVFSCALGSTLKGISRSKCLPNGQWEVADNQTCVTCSPLPDSAVGSVTLTTDGITTTASVMCLPGYEVIESSSTSCQTNGEWELTDIQCYCILPEIPSNGSFSLSADRSTITFSCDIGFTLSGPSSRTCLDDGTGWTNGTPNCNSCDTLPSLRDGNIVLRTNGTSTVAELSCDQGYTITGTAEATCQIDGTWNISLPECVLCPLVDSPTSGAVSISTNGTISSATFSCSSGYEIIGQTVITCGVNGQWNHDFPICVCSPPATILNGKINISATAATYMCDLGYSIDGDVVRTCQADGSGWSGNDPRCVLCGELTAPQSTSVNLSTDGGKTTATFTCALGATIYGESTMNCLSDGTWSSVIPNCVGCPNQTEPTNGFLTVSTNGTVTSAVFVCAEGYDVVGTSENYCQRNGTWSFQTPTCVCRERDAPSPANGSRNISSDGLMIWYSCKTGYTLKGGSVLVCQNDTAGWNGTSPACVGCPALSIPKNGTLTVSTTGLTTTAKYTCSVGTSMNGFQYLTCLDSGEWDFNPTHCEQCGILLSPASGNVTIATDGVTSVATYTCSERYRIVGVSERECSNYGTWSHSEPRCTCQEPDAPENGNVMVTRMGLRDYAIYTCNTNFTIRGPSMRQCGTNGEYWNGSDPTCVACDALQTVTGGTLDFTSDGVETIASVSCSIGSSMSGTSKIKCNSNGTWNTPMPTCIECDTVPAAANGEFKLETDGVITTAALTCDEGYKVKGSGAVSCEIDGTWNIVGEQTCSKVETSEDQENPLLAALVAVSVVSAIVITILSLVLAIFIYLHLKRRRHSFGDGSYRKYTANDDVANRNGHIPHEDDYVHPPPRDLIGVPSVPLEKARAPISHEQHVLERGETSISLAPWSHQKHVIETNKSPRGVAPADTDDKSRSTSQASISHIDISSFPPLPSVIRPPSGKSVKINNAKDEQNNVKLIHKSSKHLAGKAKKGEKESSRPMTPVNF